MPNKAEEIFLALETNAVAPDEEFHRFEVGTPLNEGFISLRNTIEQMIDGTSPSKLQVITGENGNGKTLLSNKVTRSLSDRNSTIVVGGPSKPQRGFDVLYSHISALGQANSQTCAEIAAKLRRSQLEGPEITYSLFATQIAKEFDLQYQPSLVGRIAGGVARAFLDMASFGIYKNVEEALRAGKPSQIVTMLDDASDTIKKRLSWQRRRRHFEDFLGDLNQFDSFVKTYFYSPKGQSVHVLRVSFLTEINSALQQPKQVIEQLGLVAKKVGCKAIIIIIDDCNQQAFIDQLLPVINDLSKFANPRVFLIVSMVEKVAEDIKAKQGDKSMAQRLFHNEAIRLPGPDTASVRALYDQLRTLYNDAFSAAGFVVPDRPGIRTRALQGWSRSVSNGGIERNYRSATTFIIAFLRAEGGNSLI